ncbi:MAG: hypothetical protein IANPNBLG_00473 [Bryobacteraceae bacterium]|nr:hypothetical protein [Bryobacteraceae bacterium]MCC6340744.1 hypothetical protein [Bryobacterales bacterium]
MSFSVRRVRYYYVRLEDKPGRGYELLARLASEDINLLAFSVVPYGSMVELTIFPENEAGFAAALAKHGIQISVPQHAFLIQGDDRLGALAEIHKALFDAGVNIYASSGVTDGLGHFGYIIYIKESDHAAASRALGIVS